MWAGILETVSFVACERRYPYVYIWGAVTTRGNGYTDVLVLIFEYMPYGCMRLKQLIVDGGGG